LDEWELHFFGIGFGISFVFSFCLDFLVEMDAGATSGSVELRGIQLAKWVTAGNNVDSWQGS
jgi:hypothetical protein